MKRISNAGKAILCLLIFLPAFAFAEGGFNGLEVLDHILTAHRALLIAGGIGILCGLVYVFSASKSLFYSAAALGIALLLSYLYSFYMFPGGMLPNEFVQPLRNHVLLLIFAIFTLLAARKFGEDPGRLFWYSVLNSSSILLSLDLVGFLPVDFPLAIPVQAVLYVLFSFLYSCRMVLRRESSIKRILGNLALVCFFCNLTVFIFFGIDMLQLVPETISYPQIFKMLWTLVPVGFLVSFLISAASALVAMKVYGPRVERKDAH